MQNPKLWNLNQTNEPKTGCSTPATCVTDAFHDIGLNKLEIFPEVFNPETSFSGKFLARVLFSNKHLFTDADVLDMACGSGILGIVCAIHGAKSVTCTDISPSASANTLHNASLLGVTVEAVNGDLFQGINRASKFDFIVFNLPGFEGIPDSEVDLHYVCPYSVIDSFYALAPNYLRKNGSIVTATSEIHDVSRSPLTMAKKYSYSCDLITATDHIRGRQYAYKIQVA